LFNISGSSDLTMLEINEAAGIITENIDPNAKVIFGAVTDDQIRKGEIQITVVATGFDEDRTKESPVGLITNRVITPSISQSQPQTRFTSQPEVAVAREEEHEEAISFPVRKTEQPVMIIEEKIQPRAITPRNDAAELTDDEDLEIPAFIRRKMKK
jgi:cell division protein FtsZ